MLAITLATVLTGCQADELTHARALELLKEAHRAMESAEQLLDKNKVPQAERREREAVEKLALVLKDARSSDDPKEPPRGPARLNRPPEKGEPPSKFVAPASKSAAWGRLPPEIRRAMLAVAAEDVPPQYREFWRRYFESLENGTK